MYDFDHLWCMREDWSDGLAGRGFGYAHAYNLCVVLLYVI